MKTSLEMVLEKNRRHYCPVVEFDPKKDTLKRLDLSVQNPRLNNQAHENTEMFARFIQAEIDEKSARYAIGGYGEERAIYQRSGLFEGEEPRSVHLGIDIWGKAQTPVVAPLGGTVHSFANNAGFGDYGPTIILQHQLETIVFYTLFGHLCASDLQFLRIGKFITRGEVIGHFGTPQENGDWPPHLHVQIITDLRHHVGDYPGVCTIKEKEKFLQNCPDPDLVLNLMQYAAD